MQDFVFGMVGGLGLLIMGIVMMGEGLERAAGNSLRKILSNLTNNLFMGVALGSVLTALIHSSSAVTVLIVGFTNAGLMTLKQALGVIYGANIGTTFTAQIMRLDIGAYALPIIAAGVLVNMLAQSDRMKHIGNAITGFGLLFLGLETLGSGTAYMKTNPAIREMLVKYTSTPLLAVGMGTLVTAIIQSSTAATGLVIALAGAGLIDFPAAAGVVLGNNIGTCVTALLASINTDRAARRSAVAHTLFNIVGVIVILPFFTPFITLIEKTSPDIVGQVANLHTIFNIFNVAIFMPFTGLYVKFLYKLMPDEKGLINFGPKYLDKLLLDAPEAALSAIYKELQHCHEVATIMVNQIFQSVFNNDKAPLAEVLKEEEILNDLQSELIQYVVLLSKQHLDTEQSQQIPSILHIVGDAERIGDHSKDMVELANNKTEEKIVFTDSAMNELKQIQVQMVELADLALQSLISDDIDSTALTKVQQLEYTLKQLMEQSRQGHIRRLENGQCTVRAGILYMDILSHLERISEHYANMVRRGSDDSRQIA